MMIRPAKVEDAAAIARVHIRSWRETFSPILTAEQIAAKDLDEASQTGIWTKRLKDEEGKSRFTFVAEEESLLAFVTGCETREAFEGYDSELHQIYILAEAQRKGLGQELVKALARKLVEQGYQSMLVWVMTQNPAVAFYRDALGGVFLEERPILEVNGSLKEAAYGWPDIRSLLFEGN
jgi:L-amino acid N-acyltransferase YncA